MSHLSLKGALVALLLTPSASMADDFTYWEGAQYDVSVPTLQSVAGHKLGDRITRHADIVDYFYALEKSDPARVRVVEYARSWQGRPLIYVAISSAENITKLDDYKAGMKALSDPRKTSKADAAKLINTLPGSAWLGYGVHGNEISSPDAAMMTAYHLLASSGDDVVDGILANTIVFIDPQQNPDGRDRFVNAFESSEGLEYSADRLAAEHDEPWPNGRSNHYLFDLNRDWLVMSQPETKGRIKSLNELYPLVFVDLHEMGGDSSYYFAPEAVPFNPHLAKEQRASLELFGRNNAKYFDKDGRDYFTREIFDAFYPGYGASWPSYYGAVAMTYEQASARGMAYRRLNGTQFNFNDTVKGHFLTSVSTLEVMAKNSKKFLKDFYNYRLTAIEEGKKQKVKSYIFPTQADMAATQKLAGLLASHGIEVSRSTANFKACGVSYKAGSFVVNMDQPSKRMARTFLDPDVKMEKGFVAEQERRRAKKQPDEMYDVTAWSLPLMFNVTSNACSSKVKAASEMVAANWIKPGVVSGKDATVAYLVPWGDAASVRFLSDALRAGLEVISSDKPFTNGGQIYPAGSLILNVDDNPDDLVATLERLTRTSGANANGINDSWVTDGPNFGSRHAVRMNAPKVAILWDVPTSSLSAGNARFVIERQFNYPVTPIRSKRVRSADLSAYDVLIVPESWGSYASSFGEGGMKNLQDWVKRGGTLIAFGSALRDLSTDAAGLVSLKREDAYKEELKDDEKNGDAKTVKGTLIEDDAAFKQAIDAGKEAPDSVSGVLARANVDEDHWLGAGVADTLNVLVRGRDIYSPITLDKGINVARYAAAKDILVSGHLWEQNRKQLAYKPFVTVEEKGRGHVIAFTQDPTVRAYLDGLNLIFMNAVFRGAAHSGKAR